MPKFRDDRQKAELLGLRSAGEIKAKEARFKVNKPEQKTRSQIYKDISSDLNEMRPLNKGPQQMPTSISTNTAAEYQIYDSEASER